ncbi:thiol:disulfide interchange protein tlpA [Brevibacillus reuszeri]|uniref:Cytochrome C biogenesis protein n=1 Tax=Brevibacillus reuszeri TaxID=54915 RepID=A0A0K9YX21_9BACL|nr:redoxin domain-containing protein [Brevibacillus reuszeri]KNB73269.1 cytochrome C biogenesis protein [Brevibacillus reuszeri]MED1856881.1 redoxin domain-containing protein [Brevibacillus reuszeri]GED68369.1 thiol:disulfide interchange protein tlpA [Brevibacillus reuszeri]
MKHKNALAAIVLIGLLAWGIMDTGKTPAASSATGSAEQAAGKGNIAIGIEKGNLAPDFELQALNGEKMKLSDLRGKKVIVNLWATWCPPCRAEIPDMQSFYEANKDKGVVILGVNLTSTETNVEAVSAFVQRYGMTFPILMDVDKQVSGVYKAISIPTSFIIDSSGVIQNKYIGPMNQEMMENMLSAIE